MTATGRPAVYVEALCHFFDRPPNWWYEATIYAGGDGDDEATEGCDLVIHSDGMFAEMQDALAAGRAWAEANGYAVREIEHDEEDD